MKAKYPKLPRIIEETTEPDAITGEMINKCAM